MVAQLAAKVHISTRGSRRDQEKVLVGGEGGGMQCGQAHFQLMHKRTRTAHTVPLRCERKARLGSYTCFSFVTVCTLASSSNAVFF